MKNDAIELTYNCLIGSTSLVGRQTTMGFNHNIFIFS